MNKLILLLLLIPNLVMANSDNDCFTKEESEHLIKEFAARAAIGDYLYGMATDELKKSETAFFTDKNKKRQLLIAHSTEVIFGSGKKGDHENAINDTVFPTKGCVWKGIFVLPEKVRSKCDDIGMYGYLFLFEKSNGKIVLTKISNDTRPSDPICKALLKITNKKIDAK